MKASFFTMKKKLKLMKHSAFDSVLYTGEVPKYLRAATAPRHLRGSERRRPILLPLWLKSSKTPYPGLRSFRGAFQLSEMRCLL